MENYGYIDLDESIKKNVEILLADERLFRYALRERVLQLILSISGLISLAFFIMSVWALTDTGFYTMLVEEYPFWFFKQSVLIVTAIFTLPVIILSFAFLIYYSNHFEILTLYRSYNVLRGKTYSVYEEKHLSRGKIWPLFKLGIWAALKTIHLSALQIKSAKNMSDKSTLVSYDPTLVVPIVLFENVSKEEALKISSEVGSKDRLLFIKQAYKRDFSLMRYNLKAFGIMIVVVVALNMFFALGSLLGDYLKPLTSFALIVSTYFCIQTFAMLKRRFYYEAYLVALYCAIRKEHKS